MLPFAVGGDLTHLVKKMKKEKSVEKRSFEEDHILFMVIQMIEGLKHLHKNSIVHRDMKELNILIDGNTNI